MSENILRAMNAGTRWGGQNIVAGYIRRMLEEDPDEAIGIGRGWVALVSVDGL